MHILSTSIINNSQQIINTLFQKLKEPSMNFQMKKTFISQSTDKLLSSISNLYYICNVLFPILLSTFKEYDTSISEDFSSQFVLLHSTVMNILDDAIRLFLNICIVDLENFISEGLAIGVFDYTLNSLPSKVRNYVFHVLSCIFSIHSSMKRFRSFLTQRILIKLVETVMANFFLEMQPIKEKSDRLGKLGYFQLKMELLFFQEAFKPWLSENAVEFVQKSIDFISQDNASIEIDGSDNEVIEKLLLDSIERCNLVFQFSSQ